MKSNALRFGVYLCMKGEWWWGRGTCNFCRERLHLALAAGRPAGRRRSWRRLIVFPSPRRLWRAAPSPARRHFTPITRRWHMRRSSAIHYLVRQRRYWKTAASYAEAASPGGRPFANRPLFILFFFSWSALPGNCSHRRRSRVQAVSEVHAGRFRQDKLGRP